MVKPLSHLVDTLAKLEHDMPLSEAHAHSICIKCKVIIVDPEEEFRDEESRKGYELSGLCQRCQDLD